MTLEQLSAAATQGEWRVTTPPDDELQRGVWIGTDPSEEYASDVVGVDCCCCGTGGFGKETDAKFVVALVTAYRTGQLVAVSDDAIERVFKALKSCSLWHDIDGDATIADFHIDDDMLVMLSTAVIAAMKDTQPSLAAKGTGNE